jgi:diketogulonate reductase-like aldo/keto reductase
MSQEDSIKCTIQLYNQVELPAIGLGTFKARGISLKVIVQRALASGIRHIDTATVYKVRPFSAQAGMHIAQCCVMNL